MQLADFKLYLITDRHQTAGRPLLDVVRQSLEAGVKAVQVREKDLSGAELYRLAVDMRRLTAHFDARLIINDRPDIALAVNADGVHIGINSMPVSAVRRVLGAEKIIGYSAHAVDEAERALADGADFVTFGPVYATPSKAAFGDPCGVEKLAAARTALNRPVIGLGGISQDNVTEALSADIQGIAVISAILAAADPKLATVNLLKKIEAYAQHS